MTFRRRNRRRRDSAAVVNSVLRIATRLLRNNFEDRSVGVRASFDADTLARNGQHSRIRTCYTFAFLHSFRRSASSLSPGARLWLSYKRNAKTWMFIYGFMEISLFNVMIYDNTSKFVNIHQKPGIKDRRDQYWRTMRTTNTKQIKQTSWWLPLCFIVFRSSLSYHRRPHSGMCSFLMKG